MNKYFDGKELAKEKVAMDIKYRVLTRTGIDELLNIPGVENSFIGTNYNKKTSKEGWNQKYLDRLSYAAVSESFNKDYLYYLDEVAEYVSKKKTSGKGISIIIGVALVMIVIIVVIATVRSH